MLSGNSEKEEFEQLYFLQFKFLSALTNSYEDDELDNFDESKLTNKKLMSSQPIFNAIDWSKIKIEKKELANNIVELIYDFGEPKNEPLCRFVIFYVDKKIISMDIIHYKNQRNLKNIHIMFVNKKREKI